MGRIREGRVAHIKAFVTPSVKEKVETHADAMGLSMAEYLRYCVNADIADRENADVRERVAAGDRE